MKSSKKRSPVCTRSSISIMGDSNVQAGVNDGSCEATTTTEKISTVGKTKRFNTYGRLDWIFFFLGRLKRKILSNITNSFTKHAAGFLHNPTSKKSKSSKDAFDSSSSNISDLKLLSSSSSDNTTIDNPLSQKSSSASQPAKGAMQLRSSSYSIAPFMSSHVSLSSASTSPQKKLQSMTLEPNLPTTKRKSSSSGGKKRSSSMSNSSPLSAKNSVKQEGCSPSGEAKTVAKKIKMSDYIVPEDAACSEKSVFDEVCSLTHVLFISWPVN